MAPGSIAYALSFITSPLAIPLVRPRPGRTVLLPIATAAMCVLSTFTSTPNTDFSGTVTQITCTAHLVVFTARGLRIVYTFMILAVK